jgi:hypothetical protein
MLKFTAQQILELDPDCQRMIAIMKGFEMTGYPDVRLVPPRVMVLIIEEFGLTGDRALAACQRLKAMETA